MKNLLLIIIFLSFAPFCAKGQYAQDKIEFTGTKVVRSGEDVLVVFRIQTKKGVVKANFSAIFSPVITNGQHRVSFPAILVQGRHAEKLHARNQMLSGRSADYSELQLVRPGATANYVATVPFREWMEGAALIMESSSWGCCSSETSPDRPLAEQLLPSVPCIPEPAPVPPVAAQTTGDTLALAFSFIVPESQWNEAESVYGEDRDRALIVYYRQGKSDIELSLKDNRMTLTNLIAAVNAILESSDSRVSRIVVAGFASPEGSYHINERLAWERAVAVRKYLIDNTGLQESDVSLYNGSEDWWGLQLLVAASDLRDKADILRIIDTVPLMSRDGRQKVRLQQLKELNGGVSYRYMAEHFFPLLRNGAFIRVYYDNK